MCLEALVGIPYSQGRKISRISRVGVWPWKFSPVKFQAHNRCNAWLEARPRKFYPWKFVFEQSLAKLQNIKSSKILGYTVMTWIFGPYPLFLEKPNPFFALIVQFLGYISEEMNSKADHIIPTNLALLGTASTSSCDCILVAILDIPCIPSSYFAPLFPKLIMLSAQ